MSNTYVADKLSRLALNYGLASFHAGNGKYTRHQITAVAGGLQVRAQLALGAGRYHAVRRLTYDGIEIPASNYRFHNDGASPADDYFPQDVAHPGASWINFELPSAMANENDLSKIVGLVECRETADYDANGNQTDFGYSQNFARVAADGVKLFTGSASHIDFGSYVEYRDFCGEPLTIEKDGQSIQVARFEANLVFLLQQSLNLNAFLNRVCLLSCTDWQWVKGRIRFVPPTSVNQQSKFTFDLSKVAQEFKFQANTGRSRYNGVEVAWRDQDNELLREQTPFIVDRRTTLHEPRNFYALDAGVARRHQIERLAHCTARNVCDLTDFAFIRASWKSYFVLPGDVVTLSHPTADWVARRCKVIKKTENEETGLGYNYSLQVQPAEPYSDSDTSPLQTRTATPGVNPYAAPPAPIFALTQDSKLAADGSISNVIKGTVTFGSFGFRQSGKVYWMKPGAGYEELATIIPDANNQAIFYAPNPPSGDNWFKVVAYSELGAKINNPGNDTKVTVNDKSFFIDGFPIPALIFRGFTALRPDGQVIGRDKGRVPIAAIEARIDSADVVGENLWCVLGVTLKELGNDSAGNRIHNNADFANICHVEAFNQYGESVKKFAPAPITNKVSSPVGSFSRKYADMLDGYQGWFRIAIQNNFGNSDFVYLKGAYVAYSEPAKKLRTDMPQELSAVPLNQGLRFTFQHGGTGTIFKRPLTTKYEGWQYITHGYSPIDFAGIAPNEENEYMATNSNDGALRSNYIRAKTLPQAAAAPLYTPPLGVSLALDPQFPSNIVRISVSLGVNDKPTNLYYYDTYIGQLPAGQTEFSLSGRSPGEVVQIKAMHVYNGGNNLSEPCAAQTITTYNPPPPIQPPLITHGFYEIHNQQMVVFFEPRGGSANFTVDYINGQGWQRLYTDQVGANDTIFAHPVAQIPGITQAVGYRVARHGQTGFGNEVYFEIPPGDIYEPPPDYPGGPGRELQQ